MKMLGSRAAGKIQNKKGFNGGNEMQNGEFADGSGLDWYDAKNRMYDPQIGRFFQVDELGEATLDWSLYSFAFDNPIYFNDPIGLTPDDGKGGYEKGKKPKKDPHELPWVTVYGKYSQKYKEATYWHFRNNNISFDNAKNIHMRSWLRTHDNVTRFMEKIHASNLEDTKELFKFAFTSVIPFGKIFGVGKWAVNLFRAKRAYTIGAYGTDAAITANAANLIPKKGWVDVVIHGTEDGMNFTMRNAGGSTELVSALDLYGKMVTEGYTQGTRIRLMSCFSGSIENGAASQLAKLADATVVAPKSWITVADGMGFLPRGQLMTGEGLSKLSVFK